MIYLLDTSAVSDLMRAAPRIENKMAGLGENDRVVTCAIVRGEILFGIARLPAGRRRAELEETGHQFLAALRCEPVPERAGDFSASVKLTRQQRGLALDENDLWVAATATSLALMAATGSTCVDVVSRSVGTRPRSRLFVQGGTRSVNTNWKYGLLLTVPTVVSSQISEAVLG